MSDARNDAATGGAESTYEDGSVPADSDLKAPTDATGDGPDERPRGEA